jgi:hypothetical protein
MQINNRFSAGDIAADRVLVATSLIRRFSTVLSSHSSTAPVSPEECLAPADATELGTLSF